MQARIYKPTKTAMQSGDKNNDKWILKFDSVGKFREQTMDWISSKETMDQVTLYFETAEEAISYAQKHDIHYTITYPNKKKRGLKSYANNFD